MFFNKEIIFDIKAPKKHQFNAFFRQKHNLKSINYHSAKQTLSPTPFVPRSEGGSELHTIMYRVLGNSSITQFTWNVVRYDMLYMRLLQCPSP